MASLFCCLFPVFTSALNLGLAVVTLTLRRNLQCLTAAGVEPRCMPRDSFPLVEQTHLRAGRERSDCVTACRAFCLRHRRNQYTFFFSLFTALDFFLESEAAS